MNALRTALSHQRKRFPFTDVRHRMKYLAVIVPSSFFLSHRQIVLLAGVGLPPGTAILPISSVRSPSPPRELRLVAAPGKAAVTRESLPYVEVLACDGIIPVRLARLRQDDPVCIDVENQLDQDITVHWRGIRLPSAMDGVPGLTASPVKSGTTDKYEFTPPGAGTFWYQPQANTSGRGLAVALAVKKRESAATNSELVWRFSDWQLENDGQIASDFGSMMDAALSGRVGKNEAMP